MAFRKITGTLLFVTICCPHSAAWQIEQDYVTIKKGNFSVEGYRIIKHGKTSLIESVIRCRQQASCDCVIHMDPTAGTLGYTTYLSYVNGPSTPVNVSGPARLAVVRKKKACPAGSVGFASSCYFINHVTTLSQRQAVDFCAQTYNSNLVTIDSEEELTFLGNYLTEAGYWTSAVKEGVWNWMPSRKELPLTSVLWHPSQPNNVAATCAYLAYTLQFKIGDGDCQTKVNFICEKHL